MTRFTQNRGDSAPSFLMVSLRYIGVVLLSTPLALSINEASIDYLVFAGTEVGRDTYA